MLRSGVRPGSVHGRREEWRGAAAGGTSANRVWRDYAVGMLRAIVLVILIDVSPELSAASASGFCTAPESCMVAIARTQDGRVREALKRIPDIGAKLLALRSYLRAGSGLAQRWSWTEPQIEAFAGSMHEQQITAAIASVRREFELASPGYTLWVNTQVRSLDRQLPGVEYQ